MSMKSIYLACISLALASCATVNRGTSDIFRIDTVPQGATVAISTDVLGGEEIRVGPNDEYKAYVVCDATPCALEMYRRREFVATILMNGYEETEIFITHSAKRQSYVGSAAGNVASGGLAGAVAGATIGGLADGLIGVFGGGSAYASSAAWQGLLSGGLYLGATGIAIDQGSGATQFFVPNPVTMELVKEGEPILNDIGVALFRVTSEIEKREKEFERQVAKECKSKRQMTEQCERRKLKELIETKTVELLQIYLDKGSP